MLATRELVFVFSILAAGMVSQIFVSGTCGKLDASADLRFTRSAAAD